MSKHGGLDEILRSGQAPGLVRPGVRNPDKLIGRLVPKELSGAAKHRAEQDARNAVSTLDRGYRRGDIPYPPKPLE